MANDPPEEVHRWTAKRRVALVVSLLKGETSVQHAARKLDHRRPEDWQERLPGRGERSAGAPEAPPFPRGALGELKAAYPRVSERRLCK